MSWYSLNYMKSWLEPEHVEVPGALREAVGGHPVVAARLARRGMLTPAAAQRFLDPAAYSPADPGDLPDMDAAVNRVRQAINGGEQILVWGDFDVDGQTATALLVSALRDLGAKVQYHIPNRFSEGHGIHLPTLKTWLDGGVDLVLTCDTGIAAHEAVDYARSRMVDTVITDHHALAETLPGAVAAVNPMLLPEGHAVRELPGVGVAYQLVRALYGSRSSDHLLDLVAVGIVADVMVQADDTRYWLQRGLDVLRNDPRPGFAAMLERAAIDPADLTESDLGFSLAPRLNALGRLADANPAVELLTTANRAVIAERINELEGLNQKRRFLTRQVHEAAVQKIRDDESLLKYAALVVAGEGWHTGVVGIVASRLAEDYHCPVVVLSEHEGTASGSARSVEGCDIVAAIRSQAHLLGNYGGHGMAAGLSLPVDNVFEFRRGLSQAVRAQLGQAEVVPQLALDAYVDLPEITLEFAEDIARLAPFGNGNPPLALATRNVQVKSRRTLGRKGDHLDLRVEDEAGNEQRVIWWFGDVETVPQGWFDMAYTVRPNVYNGRREALLEWLDMRPIEGKTNVVDVRPTYTVVDYRQQPVTGTMLDAIRREYPDVLVWREGVTGVDGAYRHQLREAETLVVWTMPPDALTWQAALAVVQPQTLVLCGNPSPFDRPEKLLKHLAGLLKYAHNHKGGVVEVSELAALTGQTEHTIRVALLWLNTQIPLRMTALTEDRYAVEMADAPAGDGSRYADRLNRLYAEMRAYQRYWLQQKF